MDVLKLWMENVLVVNKVFGGVIKLDFIGFYYMGFYVFVYIF